MGGTDFSKKILQKLRMSAEFRRMKKIILLITALAAAMFVGCASQNQNVVKQPRKVGVQMYSLNRFTFEDAIAKLKGLDIDGIECYGSQKLSKKYPNARTDYKLNAEERAYMKKLLKDAGLKMVSYGVTRANSEEEVDKVCQFVKEMGGERVLTEAPVCFWPAWDKACAKYGLTMLIHHHSTKDAPFWDTDYFKRHVKGFKHIKYNPDPGHWTRSGLDPVKCLKSVDGYVAGTHFKDLKQGGEFGKIPCKNVPAPYGEGIIDVKGMLAEFDRQGFDGFFMIEYEGEWDNNIPQIKKCIEFLRHN